MNSFLSHWGDSPIFLSLRKKKSEILNILVVCVFFLLIEEVRINLTLLFSYLQSTDTGNHLRYLQCQETEWAGFLTNRDAEWQVLTRSSLLICVEGRLTLQEGGRFFFLLLVLILLGRVGNLL